MIIPVLQTLRHFVLSVTTSTTTSSQAGFLLDLAILAIFALVFSVIFARLKLSIVSGQILAGVLAGPYVLGWVRDPLVLNQLSEIGVVLLLFVIGLELDPVDLRKMSAAIISLTGLEVAVAFLLGYFTAYLLGFNFLDTTFFP